MKARELSAILALQGDKEVNICIPDYSSRKDDYGSYQLMHFDILYVDQSHDAILIVGTEQ